MSKIIIVDDETVVRQSLGSMLSARGFDVRLARTGKEAAKKQLAEPAHVILLDMSMPEPDGLETATLIRSFDETVNFVAVTAYEGGFRSRPEANQIYDWVSKPIMSEPTKARLADTTRRAAADSEARRLKAFGQKMEPPGVPSLQLTTRILGPNLSKIESELVRLEASRIEDSFAIDVSHGRLTEEFQELFGMKLRNLIGTLAYRAKALGEKQMTLGSDGRFSEAVAREFAVALPMSIFDAAEILDDLYAELAASLREKELEWEWGRLEIIDRAIIAVIYDVDFELEKVKDI